MRYTSGMPWRPLPFPLPPVPPRFHKETLAQETKAFARKLFADFFAWPIERSVRILETTPEEVWQREGERRALYVFHEAARRVPAYKDFLKKHKINPEKVRTIKDFQVVPWIDKKNYLRRYPLADLSWDGLLHTNQMISVSSGSSGEPFFWPRGLLLEVEVTLLFEVWFHAFFEAHRYKTLFVNSASMGMYIGGPFSLNAVLRIAQKGYRVVVVTPGIELEDCLRILSKIARDYEQIVVVGYPPFIKDILDVGIARGARWKMQRFGLLLAGEGFSEGWRDHVFELVSADKKVAISLYGTADAAIVAHETPFSVSLRRLIISERTLSARFFKDPSRLPSFLQYYPSLRYFEEADGELIFTVGGTGVPLVRYNIHDRGGLVRYSEVLRVKDREQRTVAKKNSWSLPFVFLFGRSDFTTTIYGLNVYPENIKAALESQAIRNLVTGKFQMTTEYRRRGFSQHLLIRLELARGKKPNSAFKRLIRKSIVDTLRQVNAEYNKLYESIGARALPDIRLHSWGDPRYFALGTKQRWAQKHKDR